MDVPLQPAEGVPLGRDRGAAGRVEVDNLALQGIRLERSQHAAGHDMVPQDQSENVHSPPSGRNRPQIQ